MRRRLRTRILRELFLVENAARHFEKLADREFRGQF
jgi:hypothetical protein